MKRTAIKLLILLCVIPGISSCARKKLDKELWSERMARSEMKRFPEAWMIENAAKPRWGYTHGLVVKAMLEEWKHTNNQAYYDYAKIYADSLIDANGKIRMNYLSFNIDNINAGKILFDLYKQSNDKRYKTAMDTLRKQMSEHPRTSEGGFWHKLRYPYQMWLDGIYMASPFLTQYGAEFGDSTLFADVVNQVTLIARKTYDPETGLYYHGWDESRQQKWANKDTGCSPNFWSRSLGWYASAVVDILDYLPENTAGRDSILYIVNNLASSLAKYQDEKTGVWYQVTTEGMRQGNYLESSATAMFVYFYSKALNGGYIGNEYTALVKKAFNGMIKEFIKENADGTYTITNCCSVAGLGGDKRYRDGSFEYYISEPVVENDPKSTGSFILAAIEYEKLTRNE
ncbi:Unsaturated rhamnogalacturonyl hydrolase YteR [termite gut metagenome]|uniref:Unsaturated rhamnogalacturonyl hydrolase YteR n=1 Tax=termite gut metagenome TaxID=433724 RepID=A0A5J4STJ2_9ZZZZ